MKQFTQAIYTNFMPKSARIQAKTSSGAISYRNYHEAVDRCVGLSTTEAKHFLAALDLANSLGWEWTPEKMAMGFGPNGNGYVFLAIHE